MESAGNEGDGFRVRLFLLIESSGEVLIDFHVRESLTNRKCSETSYIY